MANINFKTINSSDYVSPSVINSNFGLVDPLGKDYITSTGTSSAGGASWSYRIWKSGYCECWGNITIGSGTELTHVEVATPVTFSSRPTSSVVGGCDGNNNAEVRYVKSSTGTIDTWIYRPDPSKTGWLEITVRGFKK